jgi:hypothetical protein
MTTENGWSGWAQAWQEEADTPPADIDAIERRVRGDLRGQAVRTWADIVASLVGLAVSAWVILDARPTGAVVGLAGIAFCLFSLAVVLGRRRPARELDSRTVTAALGWEIATARSGARSSVGGLAMAAASLVFLGLCTVMFDREGIIDSAPAVIWWLLAGLVFCVGSGLTSLWLYRRRNARVARLERMLAELTDEAES